MAGIKVSDFYLDLEQFGDKFELGEVKSYVKYVNGEATKEIEGYRYTVVVKKGIHRMTSIPVKIPGDNVFKDVDLTTVEDFFVEFENLKIGMNQNYGSSAKEVYLNATATAIRKVGKKA